MFVNEASEGHKLETRMHSPTLRLVAGLAFTLAVIGAYAAYTLQSVSRMREMQVSTIDRSRLASLQLLRIQNDLNALGLAMRDMLDNSDQYAFAAWRAPLLRMKQNLEDALRREAELSSPSRPAAQAAFLKSSFAEFWRTSNDIFDAAAGGRQEQALAMVRSSLQPRQEALSALVARLLVANHEQEQIAGSQVREIYSQIERNAYLFLGCSVILILLISASAIRSNRNLFDKVSELSSQRSELAQQLISTQESTFRAISRDLHDEFGQILTALGAMLRRAGIQAPDSKFQAQVQEASEIVQSTLEKIRSLSQSLQPVILEERGLLAAVEWHLTEFERHTGIEVAYTPPSAPIRVSTNRAIHCFRILQEALNNVARHAGVSRVEVSITTNGNLVHIVVKDQGKGIAEGARPGIGLAAMRERAALIGGHLEVDRANGTGTRIELQFENDLSRVEQVEVSLG